MELSTLENWLWDAACSIRGAIDAPKYRDYILPLLFYKRLSDVYEDELGRLAGEFGDRELAKALAQEDDDLIRFNIPNGHTWSEVRKHTTDLGQRLTDAVRAIAKTNPELEGVIDIVDFNATASGQRILDDGTLAQLIEILDRHRLGLDDVEPDILGRAYEYLLRKFAEGSGQSAGEFYTPKEVGQLMSYILDPEEGETLYDPCCGSGGLLIKAQLRLEEKAGDAQVGRRLQLYGQEINPTTFAMAKMNAFIHDMTAGIELGDTMKRPRFVLPDGSLRQFAKVTANPMWNQNFANDVYENDTFDRFHFGTPPASSADWGWIQHMHASLEDGGKMAVVLDTGSVSRGSGTRGSNKERDVRQAFVERDLIECVILLPDNLFYNTSAPGIIMVINTAKPHPDEILLINASELHAKGRPKNYLTDDHIEHIWERYRDWEAEEHVAAIITNAEAVRNDYNLSPSRYVATNDQEDVLPLEEALVLLAEAEEERAEADAELDAVLSKLGFGGWQGAH